ncbi:DUF1622 domain-containing protein [Chloroflexota bacterium]
MRLLSGAQSWGAILGLIEIIKNEFYRFKSKGNKDSYLQQIRLTVGSYLLLGMEFLIAADIIRTIVKPTLEDLAILGGIVVIRTIISYFLGKELGDSAKYPLSGQIKR